MGIAFAVGTGRPLRPRACGGLVSRLDERDERLLVLVVRANHVDVHVKSALLIFWGSDSFPVQVDRE